MCCHLILYPVKTDILENLSKLEKKTSVWQWEPGATQHKLESPCFWSDGSRASSHHSLETGWSSSGLHPSLAPKGMFFKHLQGGEGSLNLSTQGYKTLITPKNSDNNLMSKVQTLPKSLHKTLDYLWNNDLRVILDHFCQFLYDPPEN